MSQRKYEKGARITSLGMFEVLGNQWFILNGKTIHRSFIESMTLRTVAGFIQRGQLFEAIPCGMLGKICGQVIVEEYRKMPHLRIE